MLIFDEKKYGENLIKNGYQTYKNQGRERCILVRYLRDLGKDDEYIIKELDKIDFVGKEYLSEENLNLIYDRIINKASNFSYMKDIVINIYQEEIDIIVNIEDKDVRNLLFSLLVYYKWAMFSRHLLFISKKNNKKWIVENDNDIFKIANLFKLRKKDRYIKFKYLIDNKLYFSDIIGGTSMFYLPFVKEHGDIALTINNYDDVLGWLYYYLGDYKLCDECGAPTQKTINNQKKYCMECRRKVKNDNMKKYRNTNKNKIK